MAVVVKKLTLNLPFGIGGVEVEVDSRAQQVAWELYVEFSTRIATQELEIDDGSVSGAVHSLRELFAETRRILRSGGPKLGATPFTIGGATIRVLNRGIRPFLARVHSLEGDSKKLETPKIRGELEALRRKLAQYSTEMGRLSGCL